MLFPQVSDVAHGPLVRDGNGLSFTSSLSNKTQKDDNWLQIQECFFDTVLGKK